MFDLYHAPDQAAYRQTQLLDEIAAERLARLAKAGDETSTDDSPTRAPRILTFVTDVVSAVSGALHVPGRNPRGI